jgi:hypothetical protein
MNDTELVARALRSHDEHIKSYRASPRTNGRKTTTIAVLVFVVVVASVLLF